MLWIKSILISGFHYNSCESNSLLSNEKKNYNWFNYKPSFTNILLIDVIDNDLHSKTFANVCQEKLLDF
jgi:hypothetical protein